MGDRYQLDLERWNHNRHESHHIERLFMVSNDSLVRTSPQVRNDPRTVPVCINMETFPVIVSDEFLKSWAYAHSYFAQRESQPPS